jgi:hypothetical protein
MPDPTLDFYDPLAEHYHLIFEDWDTSIERQAGILNPLLASQLRSGPSKFWIAPAASERKPSALRATVIKWWHRI